MKNPLAKIFARYDALQPRERLLIALGLLGGIVLVTFSAFIDPALKRGQQAERTAIEQRAQLQGLRAQMVALQSPNLNPDVAARAELDGLKKQLDELASRLQAMEQSLVPPQQMSALLEDMIGPRSGIRLLGLKTLPPMPLLERKDDAKEPSKPPRASDAGSAGLFKHGVEIRLEGSYQDLSAYLARLEQSKMKLLWSTVSLSAINHPKLVLTLTVYTLSLDRAWLIV
jgi:MSHA biogenesis protein MshJ